MKHVESKLFNQNGHFYFSFQICITCTYLTMVFSLTLAIMSVTSDKVTSGTIAMISTLQKLIYSRCQIMFILCFMPKRSI